MATKAPRASDENSSHNPDKGSVDCVAYERRVSMFLMVKRVRAYYLNVAETLAGGK